MPTTTKAPKTAKKPSSAKTLPHATYTVRGQKRALFTLGTGEDCKLMDVPAALLELAASGQDTPESYVVEVGLRPRGPGGKDELAALLAEYLAQAERHQAVPMTKFALRASLEMYAAAA
jgi:hypothetical protein